MSNVYQPMMLARSRAGHDQGKLYLILREEDGFCFLVDGKIRRIENPKKKKRMHLQTICHLPSELKEMMAEVSNDSDIRRILKKYKNSEEPI